MSFLGGAECSTAGNPLSQFTKHTQDDKSLQRDRLVGRAPGGGLQGMRSSGVNGSQDGMMNDFLQQGGQLPQTAADAFAMDQMRNALENTQMRANSQSPAAWAQEYGPAMQGQAQSPFNAAEFAQFQQAGRTASPVIGGGMNGFQPSTMNGGFQRPMGMGGMGMMSNMGYGMGGMGGMSYMNQQQLPQNQIPQQQQSDKGKGKMVELDDEDWEAQFAKLDLQEQEDVDAEAEAAIEKELNELDREALENDNYDNAHMGEFDHWDGFDSLGTHSAFQNPQLGEYMFEQDNMFKDMQNPYEEGLRIMTQAGNLSLAALAFEAAVQQDPQHIEAWSMLGSAQAQNEKETPAIRALEQTLKLDPNNLGALMGLAVSYTNEGYDSTAYRTLERWLSIKYPSIIAPSSLSSAAEVGFTDRHELHEKVTSLFISAAQLSPDGDHMDPDVQVGLGVLFYGAEEYDKAVDCFEAALGSSEDGTSNGGLQVHLLWNRLGATLANSGRSEEAINAYEKALTLNPNFVRARYNLGVSCINIGCYDEAASHLLGALAMHKVVEREGREKARAIINGEGPSGDGLGGDGGGRSGVSEAELEKLVSANQSSNLYDTLRRVFNQMGRRDLADRVVVGMDVESFRGDFEF